MKTSEYDKLIKIEKDIIYCFSIIYPKIKQTLLSQIPLIEKVHRDFTNIGVFISFKFKDNNYKKNSFSKKLIINDLYLISNELEYESAITMHLEKDGKIDYIELFGGFKTKRYPNEYKIIYKDTHIIVDD